MVSEASVSVLQGIFQLDTKSTEFYCPFFLIARPETTFALHNLSCLAVLTTSRLGGHTSAYEQNSDFDPLMSCT